MPQEDKFKREIDRIGLVLAKLLGLLLNKTNHHEETVKDVIRQTKDELNIDLPGLLEMDDAVQYLINEKSFSNDHLRLFAHLLYEMTHNAADEEQQTKLKNKALSIYEYVHANATGTLYLDVVYRIRELKGVN